MSDIVGIDLGTTNSLIGIMEAGFPLLLADENGERLTPSVVHIPENGQTLVGRPAARMRALAPEATVYSVKRLIGLRGTGLQEEDTEVPYRIVRRKDRPLRIRIGRREYASEEISAMVLQKLKHDGEIALGRPLSRAVI